MTKCCHCCNGSNINWCLEWLCEEDEPSCDVGYFYGFEEGKIDPPSPFDFPSPAITRGGITQDLADTTKIEIANTGLYEVTYILTTNNASASRFALKLNDDPILPQTVYSGGQSKYKAGQAFIEVTTAPSILKLVTVDDITLESGMTDPPYISASLIIRKVCES